MSKWTPQNDDPVLTLAAIRWFAISLEKLAMDLYVTDRERYPEIKDVLAEALKTLGKMRDKCEGGKRPKSANAADYEDGCGPGLVNCNGVCLPECDRIAEY
jgi:hypothetical protein